MRTAVDSSVLLDVLGADTAFGGKSREALRTAYNAGTLVACDIVWAEVCAHFASATAFKGSLEVLGVRFEAISEEAAALAGRLWRAHRARSRRRQPRVIADFLIGAHARLHADQLLTRDRGFYRRYFSGLRVLDPTERR